tara:strand:+ start:6740 stop:6997 length:258 start_codon:yes stop_codon:yes gene_type:complete
MSEPLKLCDRGQFKGFGRITPDTTTNAIAALKRKMQINWVLGLELMDQLCEVDPWAGSTDMTKGERFAHVFELIERSASCFDETV